MLAPQCLDDSDKIQKCSICKLLHASVASTQWSFCMEKAQLPERMKLPPMAGIVEGHDLHLPSSQDAHNT